MVRKSFSLIFSLLLVTAFLCFTTTNAAFRLFGAHIDFSGTIPHPQEAGDGIVGIPAPPYKVAGHGSPKGDAPFAVKKTIGSPAKPSKRVGLELVELGLELLLLVLELVQLGLELVLLRIQLGLLALAV
nr:uncharacterized protein LOC109161108 [Ipomoea batatas]